MCRGARGRRKVDHDSDHERDEMVDPFHCSTLTPCRAHDCHRSSHSATMAPSCTSSLTNPTRSLSLAALVLCACLSSVLPLAEGKRKGPDLNFFIGQENVIATSIIVPPLSGFANSSLFGAVGVIDEAITAVPNDNSTEIGRAKGMLVWVDPDASSGQGIQTIFTAVFNEASGYGGSTLSFQGYNQLGFPLREITISGGTGRLRLARGWATITDFLHNNVRACMNVTAHVRF